MAFDFSRRTANISKWGNLLELSDDEKHPGIDLPIVFAVNEKDLERLVPTPKAAPGETEFVSLIEFLFDGDGKFLYPYLSPLPINRSPDTLTFTIWYDANDDRKKFTIGKVKAKDIEYQPMSSGKNGSTFGQLSMHIVLRDLTREQYYEMIACQKSSRDIQIKAATEDLFEEPAEKEQAGEEQTEADLKLPEKGKKKTQPKKKTSKKTPGKKKASKTKSKKKPPIRSVVADKDAPADQKETPAE